MSRKESPELFEDPGRSESIGIDKNIKPLVYVLVDQKVKETEFVKAIVIYVG